MRSSGIGLLPNLAQWSSVEQCERNGNDEHGLAPSAIIDPKQAGGHDLRTTSRSTPPWTPPAGAEGAAGYEVGNPRRSVIVIGA